VIPRSTNTEPVTQVHLGAALKVRQRAERSIGTLQESGVRNRVGNTEIEKRGKEIKTVCEMIVPGKNPAAGAQPLRRARYGKRSIHARAEIKQRPFPGVSEPQRRVPYAGRGSRARLRSRWVDEQIRHAHIYREVWIE